MYKSLVTSWSEGTICVAPSKGSRRSSTYCTSASSHLPKCDALGRRAFNLWIQINRICNRCGCTTRITITFSTCCSKLHIQHAELDFLFMPSHLGNQYQANALFEIQKSVQVEAPFAVAFTVQDWGQGPYYMKPQQMKHLHNAPWRDLTLNATSGLVYINTNNTKYRWFVGTTEVNKLKIGTSVDTTTSK